MKDERIVCAAIHYHDWEAKYRRLPNIETGTVVCGLRHADCIATFVSLSGKRSVTPEAGEYVQGFVTTKNRFVTRAEGLIIAKAAFQVDELSGGVNSKELYSEDLY